MATLALEMKLGDNERHESSSHLIPGFIRKRIHEAYGALVESFHPCDVHPEDVPDFPSGINHLFRELDGGYASRDGYIPKEKVRTEDVLVNGYTGNTAISGGEVSKKVSDLRSKDELEGVIGYSAPARHTSKDGTMEVPVTLIFRKDYRAP